MELDEKSGNYNGIYHSSMKLASLIRRTNQEKALLYYEKAYNTAENLKEPLYKVSSSMALGDFYNLYLKNPAEALEKYFIAQYAGEGKIGDKNMAKINKRIEDVKAVIGENKFNEIQNRFNDEIKQK